jgi:hypothetical protein
MRAKLTSQHSFAKRCRFHVAFCLTLILLAICLTPQSTQARNPYRKAFFKVYPQAKNSVLDTVPSHAGHCGLCHYDFSGGGTRNPYGLDVEATPNRDEAESPTLPPSPIPRPSPASNPPTSAASQMSISSTYSTILSPAPEVTPPRPALPSSSPTVAKLMSPTPAPPSNGLPATPVASRPSTSTSLSTTD